MLVGLFSFIVTQGERGRLLPRIYNWLGILNLVVFSTRWL